MLLTLKIISLKNFAIVSLLTTYVDQSSKLIVQSTIIVSAPTVYKLAL